MKGGDRHSPLRRWRDSFSPSDSDTRSCRRVNRRHSRGTSLDRDQQKHKDNSREKQVSVSRKTDKQRSPRNERRIPRWDDVDRQRSPRRRGHSTERSASPSSPRLRRRRDYSDDDRGLKRRSDRHTRSISPHAARRKYDKDPSKYDRRTMRHRDSQDESISDRTSHGQRNGKELDCPELGNRGRNRHSYRDKATRRFVESASPPSRQKPSMNSPSRINGKAIRSNAPLPTQNQAFNKDPSTDSTLAQPSEKQLPSLAPTGALAKETNTVAGTAIILKYNEPPESRLPPASSPWRLFIFKDSSIITTLNLHERSCWLFGRERVVVDHLIEHPSCSKQHAVLQFRWVEKRNEYGERKGGVRPYVIDLDSANGTKVNGDKIPERRYVEVRSGDVLTFGESTREYVLMLPPKD